jgi:hypothetical protein
MTVLAGLQCVLIASSRFQHHAEAGDGGSGLPARLANESHSYLGLIVTQIVQKFPAFHETLRSIILLTRARQ